MAGDIGQLEEIARYIRYLILRSSTEAGSGHPTSALSATELMVGLIFGGFFRYDTGDPDYENNDRLIFSKGHATPLYYGLWTAAGVVSEEEMMTYRQFTSRLEGHPTSSFPYVDAATGSLGQGLSVGAGMALNAKYLDKLPYRTYVLLGDSEMAEGSQWETIQLGAHYGLDNLVGVIDVNRLGQRGETMYGRDTEAYRKRISAFGWHTRVIDGHSIEQVLEAFSWAMEQKEKPCMIIAETVKGKGVSFLEDKNGWHGKAVGEDKLNEALQGLGDVDTEVRGAISRPDETAVQRPESEGIVAPLYEQGEEVATRNAYGNALKRIYPKYPHIVSLDGEVCNSTGSKFFRDEYPDRFFEMYVAEQNMVGAAIGLSGRGKLPFVSTFAAFMTRAFDQIRMAPHSGANIKFVGSHAGVSIGKDGPSQMGLEDLAMFRSLQDSVVLYPCDAVSTEKLVDQMAAHSGISYLRTTRGKTPVIYSPDEDFPIGGCKVLRQSREDKATVAAAGVTLHEALSAAEQLQQKKIPIRVIDLYSVKPLDARTLKQAAAETGGVITVEDHYPSGGIGEAVSAALGPYSLPVRSLAVARRPRSGEPQELLNYEEISAEAIVGAVEDIIACREETVD
ncbi:MAG: transketolase [Verrucomicrobiota bacterium]